LVNPLGARRATPAPPHESLLATGTKMFRLSFACPVYTSLMYRLFLLKCRYAWGSNLLPSAQNSKCCTTLDPALNGPRTPLFLSFLPPTLSFSFRPSLPHPNTTDQQSKDLLRQNELIRLERRREGGDIHRENHRYLALQHAKDPCYSRRCPGRRGPITNTPYSAMSCIAAPCIALRHMFSHFNISVDMTDLRRDSISFSLSLSLSLSIYLSYSVVLSLTQIALAPSHDHTND
jgi:hypothetical protein